MEIPERIAKILARAGVASRRESEKLIRSGDVSVNENIVLDPSTKIRKSDRVKVRGKIIGSAEATRVWRYYKPKGLVTSESDERNRPTIFEMLPKDLPRVMSIGRLDISSEGLLLLTNNGMLKRKLELPKTGLVRRYRVRAKGVHSERSINILRKGIALGGEKFRPMTIILDRVQGANIWYTVELKEGRNREIRRTFKAINLQVNRLIRVSFGPFDIGHLLYGEIKEIPDERLKKELLKLCDW